VAWDPLEGYKRHSKNKNKNKDKNKNKNNRNNKAKMLSGIEVGGGVNLAGHRFDVDLKPLLDLLHNLCILI